MTTNSYSKNPKQYAEKETVFLWSVPIKCSAIGYWICLRELSTKVTLNCFLCKQGCRKLQPNWNFVAMSKLINIIKYDATTESVAILGGWDPYFLLSVQAITKHLTATSIHASIGVKSWLASKGITIEGFLPMMLREFVPKASRARFGGKNCTFFAKKLITHSFE